MVEKQRHPVESPWLTIEQSAQYLQVSVGTVRNWIWQRRIPHAKRGKVVRLHKTDLDKWLRIGERPEHADSG